MLLNMSQQPAQQESPQQMEGVAAALSVGVGAKREDSDESASPAAEVTSATTPWSARTGAMAAASARRRSESDVLNILAVV